MLPHLLAGRAIPDIRFVGPESGLAAKLRLLREVAAVERALRAREVGLAGALVPAARGREGVGFAELGATLGLGVDAGFGQFDVGVGGVEVGLLADV